MLKLGLLTVFAIWLNLINRGDCIDCYVCGPSTYNCMDNRVSNCRFCLKGEISGKICRNIGKGGGQTMYAKSCGVQYGVPIPNSRFVVGYEQMNRCMSDQQSTICACDDQDLCNAAPRSVAIINILIISTAIAYTCVNMY